MRVHNAERNNSYFSIFFCGCKQPKSIHIVVLDCKDTSFHMETSKASAKIFNLFT